MFDQLVWQEDQQPNYRLCINDVAFFVQPSHLGGLMRSDDCLILYKSKPLVDLYERVLTGRDFHPQNIFELGMWDGGSVAFWFELFQPKKHVAVDLSRRGDSEYFKQYVASRHLENRLRTYWGVDQSDSSKIREIVGAEFDEGLDLVIDDASHMYGPTKSSFETLFPLLRPGGLYIIEDWDWEYSEDFHSPDHPWAAEASPANLTFELVEATGTHHGTVGSLTISAGLVVVERGWMQVPDPTQFQLEKRITRRPEPSTRRSPVPAKSV